MNFKKAKKIARKVLGKNYELEIIFVSPKKMQELNCRYRKKNRPANVLAFSLSPKLGQLFLAPRLVKQNEMPRLFVHGLLHLKGYRHGVKMEKAELRWSKLL